MGLWDGQYARQSARELLGPGQNAFDDVGILRVDYSPCTTNLLQRIEQGAVSRWKRSTLRGHVTFQRPATPRDCNVWRGEACCDLPDAQATVLEHRLMREFMRALDLGPSLPPDTDNINELGVFREELSEGVHIVPIPGLGKGIDDARDFSDFRRHG
ncbi:MAG TPA: hypothetical protein VFC18_02710 [Burkholderiales bacterium]|nr:hypothetical protein [Burkholderiales bacterium]